MQAMASAYRALVVDCAPVLGRYSRLGPAGNKWRLKRGYSDDGTHLVPAAYAIAAGPVLEAMALWDAIAANPRVAYKPELDQVSYTLQGY